MTRTRAAKKTASAPAKKTAAKKAAAAPARRRTPCNTTGLSLVGNPTTTPEPGPTLVDLRHPLQRRRTIVGPITPSEHAAVRAALDTARLRLPIPVRTWNGSAANLTDGTLLIHNPGPDRTFTAHIACPRGAIHGYPITSADDLKTARAITRICERRHTANTPSNNDDLEYDWHKAISNGTQTNRLTEGIKTARTANADTQPLSKQDIAAGLAARATDTASDAPKEHPQP